MKVVDEDYVYYAVKVLGYGVGDMLDGRAFGILPSKLESKSARLGMDGIFEVRIPYGGDYGIGPGGFYRLSAHPPKFGWKASPIVPFSGAEGCHGFFERLAG